MNDRQVRDEPEALEPAVSHTMFNPIQLVWKHKGLIVLGIVIGAVLGTIYYVQARPVYQSAAQVLVVKKRPDALPLPGSESRHSEDYLGTHQVMIKSPLIVAGAIREGKLKDLDSFAGFGDPTGRIIEGLKIVREVSKDGQLTNILTITFRGSVSPECKLVVDAIIESYRKSLNGDYVDVSDETARLITQAKDILENKLTVAEEKYKRFRLDHPFLWKSEKGVSLTQDRLQSIESKRSALLVRQTEIEGRIALFKKALAENRNRDDMLAMVTQSSGRLAAEAGRTSAPEDPLQALMLQLAILREDYGKDHPQVKAIEKRIGFYRDRRDHSGKKEDGAPVDPVQAHLTLLMREAEDSRYGAEELTKLLKNEQEEAKKLVSFENQDESYRNEIVRNQQLLESISKRLTEVNILKDFGGFIFQIISPSGNGSKVGPNPVPIFVIASFLGVLAGFGMAYLAELSDQSFRTPEEIRRQLGLPIIGHVPYFEKREAELQKTGPEGLYLNPSLCTVYRSKSREAEAYRVVRTALFFANHGQGHKVIQVTSPDVGDGKSTLASNLAVSIAQSGKSVLIVDADFRRPRAHKVFGMKPTQGLASVIMEQAELIDVIQASAVPGLSVLPCGPIPENPAELLTQKRFREVLALLREKFDFVIVDTPPLLAVTDPSIVAPHVDGVIMTVRISKNGRPHAKRAKEILASLGANVLGVVVNGVGRDAEGYGYEKYHYGYTYKSYEYTYTNDDDAPYVKDGADASSDGYRDRRGDKKKTGFFSWLFKQ